MKTICYNWFEKRQWRTLTTSRLSFIFLNLLFLCILAYKSCSLLCFCFLVFSFIDKGVVYICHTLSLYFRGLKFKKCLKYYIDLYCCEFQIHTMNEHSYTYFVNLPTTFRYLSTKTMAVLRHTSLFIWGKWNVNDTRPQLSGRVLKHNPYPVPMKYEWDTRSQTGTLAIITTCGIPTYFGKKRLGNLSRLWWMAVHHQERRKLKNGTR